MCGNTFPGRAPGSVAQERPVKSAYPPWGVLGQAGLPLTGSSAENCSLYSPPTILQSKNQKLILGSRMSESLNFGQT